MFLHISVIVRLLLTHLLLLPLVLLRVMTDPDKVDLVGLLPGMIMATGQDMVVVVDLVGGVAEVVGIVGGIGKLIHLEMMMQIQSRRLVSKRILQLTLMPMKTFPWRQVGTMCLHL
ncbi:hypothetical protein Gorai_003673 [Gossypium raimondii]|uniref:Secreted protein n=1 Tax=Gossypium raimondii TaxID=29730 RepID=A0A7J8QQD2_GOSRA|nr:hypothetical protein [Gossypium raimondii]